MGAPKGIVASDPATLEAHEVAAIFPLMAGEQYEAFKADVAANGLREPIWLFDGKVVDGRNRLRACLDTGTEPRFREWGGDEDGLLEFVLSSNLHRRHLDASQRAMIGVRIKEYESKRAAT